MTLYRKYRPQTFQELKGQDHVVEVLSSALESDRVAHAYLFTGPRGTGKTSSARLLARAINCTSQAAKPCNTCDLCTAALQDQLTDLIEIDAASHGLVDDARALVEQARFMPSQAQKKIYIIDEVHMLSKSAFNALLKIIEEPPDHVHFILATTEAHKVLATITSRCQRFDFHLADSALLIESLAEVCEKEHITPEKKALELIAHAGRGSFRDALSILEQMIGQDTLTEKHVHDILGLSHQDSVDAFLNALLQQDQQAAFEQLQNVYMEGGDLYQFCLMILERLREALHSGTAVQLSWIEHFYSALDQLRDPVLPLLPLEIAIAKCLDVSQTIQAPQQESVVQKKQEPMKTQDQLQKDQVIPQKSEDVSSGDPSQEFSEPSESPVSEEKEQGRQQHSEPSEEVSPLQIDLDAYVASIEQSSLRTLLRYSHVQPHQDGLTIRVRSQFELDKIRSQENMKYLLEKLQESTGQKLNIHIELQNAPKDDTTKGLSTSDLESVF